jgi:uncharacterized membrane protein YgdD (TMEM256/DUF423 family)
MKNKTIIVAAFLGMLAIILGAFGAHALKKILTIEQLNIFETGVKYQMYHALFLLLVCNLQMQEKTLKTIYKLTVFGIILFSGSIYLLATKTISGIDFKFIGILTPIGGLLLIGAWAILMVNFMKRKQ